MIRFQFGTTYTPQAACFILDFYTLGPGRVVLIHVVTHWWLRRVDKLPLYSFKNERLLGVTCLPNTYKDTSSHWKVNSLVLTFIFESPQRNPFLSLCFQLEFGSTTSPFTSDRFMFLEDWFQFDVRKTLCCWWRTEGTCPLCLMRQRQMSQSETWQSICPSSQLLYKVWDTGCF